MGIGNAVPAGILQVGTNPSAPGLIVTGANRVGIGTSAPGYPLDVTGEGRFTGNVYAPNFLGNVTQGYTAGGWVEDTGNNKIYAVNPNYNVGIGNTAPSAFKLQVAGAIGPNVHNTYDLGSSTMRWRHLYLAGGSLHLGDDGNEAIIGYDTTRNYIGFDPDGSGSTRMVLTRTNGNVGIGTTNPTPANVFCKASSSGVSSIASKSRAAFSFFAASLARNGFAAGGFAAGGGIEVEASVMFIRLFPGVVRRWPSFAVRS